MISSNSRQSTTTADDFVERYGVTPRFFVRHCLLPSLLALRRVSCFYRGVLVETLETPAWKTRVRALRTVFAMADAKKVAEKQIKIPPGALGPAHLATIRDGLLDTDRDQINADFLVRECLKPALDAVNIALLFYRGRLVDSLQIRDCRTQLEAANIALKIHKAYPSEHDNIHFATYRDIALLGSDVRQKSRAIQIVRKSQLVYVR